MWELFQQMMMEKITPNQLYLLYAIKNKISVPQINQHLEVKGLIELKHIVIEGGDVSITPVGVKTMVKYSNYFIKAKKKTNMQLMGKSFLDKINKYRDIFPSGKLPSGKPGRVNVRTLEQNFRWFFDNYDFSWEEILKATKQYVNAYEDTDYLYMKTSQYFISKEDKNKIKTSELADYCDMLREGITPEKHHFKDNVV